MPTFRSRRLCRSVSSLVLSGLTVPLPVSPTGPNPSRYNRAVNVGQTDLNLCVPHACSICRTLLLHTAHTRHAQPPFKANMARPLATALLLRPSSSSPTTLKKGRRANSIFNLCKRDLEMDCSLCHWSVTTRIKRGLLSFWFLPLLLFLLHPVFLLRRVHSRVRREPTTAMHRGPYRRPHR